MNGFIVGFGPETNEYVVNGVRYIVENRFEPVAFNHMPVGHISIIGNPFEKGGHPDEKDDQIKAVKGQPQGGERMAKELTILDADTLMATPM